VCGCAVAEQYEVAVKDAKLGAECTAAGNVLVPMVKVFGRWVERSLEAFQLVWKAAVPLRRWPRLGIDITCVAACRWGCID
jgi:hypothetical protein